MACFQRQTYAPRELVIVFQWDDHETRDYLATLTDPTIRMVGVPASPRLSTGQLRNRSFELAAGHYVAIWDDDDWFDAARLARQIEALRKSGQPACVLSRLLLYDEQTQSAFVSGQRYWEGSLVAERAAVPAYPALQRGEDTPVVIGLRDARKLVALDCPELYIYVCHGRNTWHRTHWEEGLLPDAQALPKEASERVGVILQDHRS